MEAALIGFVIIIALALAFDFINGFHDTANAIATSVATRVLTPAQAALKAKLKAGLGASVALDLTPDATGVAIEARVGTTGPTGVEMEALTAASVSLLTLYDMLKAAQKDMRIEGVRLLSKTGGKSGDWHRDDST